MTEPELRALAARDATDNPFGKMLERIAEAQAERDAARAELDAERERVRVLREALEKIAEERDAGRHDGLPEPCPAHEAEVMWHIARALLTRAAALGVGKQDGEKEKGNG